MKDPDLPCRYEIENVGTTASASTLEQICTTVFSEGGYVPPGRIRSVDTGPAAITVGNSDLQPVISIRLAADKQNQVIVPINYTAISTSNDDVLIRIILNGELFGDSFQATDNGNTVTEVDTSATLVSGGQQVWSDYINQTSKGILADFTLERESFALAATASGVSDVLTIAAQARQGSANVSVALNFKEIT
jgi:hypothetical protein